jgi:hypothetical protein
MGFILLTHKYLKQFARKNGEPYNDSLVRVRVNLQRARLTHWMRTAQSVLGEKISTGRVTYPRETQTHVPC